MKHFAKLHIVTYYEFKKIFFKSTGGCDHIYSFWMNRIKGEIWHMPPKSQVIYIWWNFCYGVIPDTESWVMMQNLPHCGSQSKEMQAAGTCPWDPPVLPQGTHMVWEVGHYCWPHYSLSQCPSSPPGYSRGSPPRHESLRKNAFWAGPQVDVRGLWMPSEPRVSGSHTDTVMEGKNK